LDTSSVFHICDVLSIKNGTGEWTLDVGINMNAFSNGFAMFGSIFRAVSSKHLHTRKEEDLGKVLPP